MGKQYSKQELEQIRTLAASSLTNKEIAQHLGRAEAGVRNIRHRMKLKTNTQNQLQSLLRHKAELEKKERELSQTQNTISWQIDALQRKREEIQTQITLDEQTLEQKLQTAFSAKL